MHYKTAIAAVAALSIPVAFAKGDSSKEKGSAIIQNHCEHEVYLWSIADSAEEKRTKLEAGGTYSEKYRVNDNGGGVSIKISDEDSQDKVTQFEYTLSGGEPKVYYDLSNIDGYPFDDGGVTINPSDESCPVVNCPPGVKHCSEAYNKPDDDHATHGCPISTDLELILCAGNSKADSKRKVNRKKAARHPHAAAV